MQCIDNNSRALFSGLQTLYGAENFQPHAVFIAQKMLDQILRICRNFLFLFFLGIFCSYCLKRNLAKKICNLCEDIIGDNNKVWLVFFKIGLFWQHFLQLFQKKSTTNWVWQCFTNLKSQTAFKLKSISDLNEVKHC